MNTTIKRVVTNFVIKVEPPSTGHSKYQTFSNSGKIRRPERFTIKSL